MKEGTAGAIDAFVRMPPEPPKWVVAAGKPRHPASALATAHASARFGLALVVET